MDDDKNLPVEFDPDRLDQVDQMILTANDDSMQKDFEKARLNLLQVSELATESIKELMEVASQSQHPRAYEALARMIESTVQVNRELLEAHHSIRRAAAVTASATNKAKNITNNLFVGSTAQLQKMLEDLRKGQED